MRWRRKPKVKDGQQARPRKLFLRAALIGLAVGLTGLGSLMEDMLRATRNSMHTQAVSGDILFVKIDDRSVRQIGRWPWPRSTHAKLADRLTDAGANRIFFDVMFESKSDPAEDRALAEAIRRSGKVTLPVRVHKASADSNIADQIPLPILSEHAKLVSISAAYNHQNAAWKLPYAFALGDAKIPSMAAALANTSGEVGTQFPIDYSFDPATVPSVSAAAVLDGSADQRLIAGRDVVIGASSEALGDVFFIPGQGRMAGAYVQIMGAETLKAGRPMDLGWIPAYLLALIVCGFVVATKRQTVQNLSVGAAGLTLLIAPGAGDAHLVFFDVLPAGAVIGTLAIVLGWRRFRQRGLVDNVSGLPNLTALRAHKGGRDQTLIAARIINYAEIVTALPADGERQLVEQIVSRFSIGSVDGTFYKGDGGIFAWFEQSRTGIAHHIDALASLFRNPLKVGNLSIDIALSFGVDIGSSRSLSSRLGSALLAAEEAAHEGLKWKYYDPETLQNASWKLSMLSQLDAAIDQGEVWIAFQPKLDLNTRKIIGAEALARWTHPEKGPIAATEFVAAAEQHDRIGKLTQFVLEKSIAAAATLHRRGHEFDIAVNLSGRLLGEKKLAKTIVDLLALHGVSPTHLTLELTETAALAGGGDALDILAKLREAGVRIAIDDYGTGLSTLDYLKKIPASEIKIDQSFVKGMRDNRSDRVMVQSTIALAHSLGRQVVAEGVEQNDTLEMLARMKCDVAQGYIVGRPMSLDSLLKRMTSEQRRDVA